jgi:O-antigen/teichoic acid export membrane protein
MLTTQAMAAALDRLPALAIGRIGTRGAALLGFGATVFFFSWSRDALVETAITSIALADIACVFVLGIWSLRPAIARLTRQPVSLVDIRSAIQAGLPLGLSSVAVWLYVKLDTLILAAFVDWTTLGAYTAAVRLAEVLGGIPTALNSAVLPTLARLWSEDQRRFWIMRDTLLAITTTSMGFICLIVFVFAGPIASATYHLANAVPYLQILIWGQVFAACGVICNAALQVNGQNRAVAHISFSVALLSVPVYLALIVGFGGMGAAIGTVALYAAILPIGLLWHSSRATYVPLLKASAIVTLALGFAFATLLLTSQFVSVPFGLKVLLACLAYLMVCVLGYVMTATSTRSIWSTHREC